MSEGKRPRCSYCPRYLTDPVSITRGAGPVCWAKAVAVGQVKLPPAAKAKVRKGSKKGEVVADPRQLSFFFMAVELQP